MSGPHRVNLRDVPAEPNLREEEGWARMHVQFGLATRIGSDQLLLGRTVLPPGARHERPSTSDGEVLLLWGWPGAGSLQAAGCELHDHR